MEKQISIIIPTYNMENYIGKCLDSLIIPEFDQVEVLVVNDGSKDKSSEIAHEYSRKYPNSIRVIDKENGNYGSCINAALPQCSGRYVKILDADDTFNTDVFSEFVQNLKNTAVDVILTDMVVVENEDRIIKDGTIRSKIELQPNQIYQFDGVAQSILNLGMHSITYSRSIFNKYPYHQSEGVSYTDNEWMFFPMALCKTVSYHNVGYLYLYLLGREGQTMDPTIYVNRISHIFKVYDAMVEIYTKYESTPTISTKYLEERLINGLVFVYNRVINIKNQDASTLLSIFDQKLKNKSPQIYNLLSLIPINSHSSYRLIASYRKSNYKSNFNIPYNVKFRSAISKLLKIKL